MQSLSRLLPLCTLGLGIGLAVAWITADSAPSATSGPVVPAQDAPKANAAGATSAPAASATLVDDTPGPTHAPASDVVPDPAPAISTEERARLFAEMEAAYTTYDPAALPKLSPRLRHSDPEVRAYAREAIVQLGHAAGAAPLRAAARDARDPREAAALLDAAEFLELPPAAPVAAADFPRVADQSPVSRRGAPRN